MENAPLRPLERFAPDGTSAPRSEGQPVRAAHLRHLRRAGSGVFRATDEYVGLERLDRAELDETDD
jgi:hypothetical protein